MEICTLIDEEKEQYYDSYHLNDKVMKPKLIQLSLQFSLQRKTTLSSLYYLNEFYHMHFVIIESSKYYETSLRAYSKDFILKQGNRYSFHSLNPVNDSYLKSPDLVNLVIESDLKKAKLSDIYQKKLESISKYKISDLQLIATDLKIYCKINGKNKTKQILYDEINLFHFNN